MKERKEYIEKLNGQLKEWDRKIEDLEAKAKQAKQDARSDYQNQLQTLKGKRQEAASRINEIREASEDAWQELRSGAEAAFSRMGEAMDNAISMFK